MGNINNLHKNRVEQAGFAVLKAPDIPSILVETAFISNVEEERKLKTAKFQQQVPSRSWPGLKPTSPTARRWQGADNHRKGDGLLKARTAVISEAAALLGIARACWILAPILIRWGCRKAQAGDRRQSCLRLP
jgi:hypothetical protein